MSSSAASGGARAPGGKCKWQWSTARHDWVKIEDRCHGSGVSCHKTGAPTAGKEPPDGTIIVRVCK